MSSASRSGLSQPSGITAVPSSMRDVRCEQCDAGGDPVLQVPVAHPGGGGVGVEAGLLAEFDHRQRGLVPRPWIRPSNRFAVGHAVSPNETGAAIRFKYPNPLA